MLDAAQKLSIAAKSHSSSISDADAKLITDHLKKGKEGNTTKNKPQSSKEILSVKKAPITPKKSAPVAKSASPKNSSLQEKPSKPIKPSLPNRPKEQISVPPASPKTQHASSSNNKNLTKTPPTITTKAINPPINKPSPPARPKTPELSSKDSVRPLRPNSLNKNPVESQSNNSNIKRPIKAKATPPQIVSKPITPPSQARISPPNQRSSTLTNKKQNKPELVGRPQPKRPTAPPPRPEIQRQDRRRNLGNPRSINGPNQRNNNHKRPGLSQRPNSPSEQGSNSKQQQGRSKGNTLELVGKPIRRDKSNNPPPPNRAGGNRQGSQNRPNMPSGMRRPVAPGELMQLQKPTGRPTAPPPRRVDSSQTGNKKEGSDKSKSPNAPVRPPNAAPPKRPSHRPGTGAPGAKRPGRPDWDDSAKLDALRNKSPQKQRQKVHIIGENDDALTTQTSGFAGEKQALVLSASLARPSKPKSSQKAAAKPIAAMRKRKKETTRQRQKRRAMELRAAREAKQIRPEMIIVPESNLTVQELADMLSVESSEIIKSLFFKGITATVTQSLDLTTIETVAEEFGVPVLQDDIEEAAKKTVEMIEEEDLAHLIRRPPVVTVMGHVDHGKTSLLDAIRKARVAAGEAGGITQHIGAYQVEIKHNKDKKKLTFLDTPGHEAFTAMRARGTKVTDVAVLVVAADDGVRPQTLEAISHARAAEVPIVVAINKIDKEGASSDRVKQELSDQSLLAEDWGGDVVMVPVSAIKGENIDKLLEMILLVSEVEDLQANPNRLAKGTVVEAHLDKAKGPVATLLIQNGTLRTGDVLAAGPVLGKIRAMVNDNRSRLKEAGPSCAVEALGFSEVPTAGDEFEVYPDEKSARAVVGERASDARASRLAQQMASRRVSLTAISGQASEGDLKELNLILKADVQGSVEAILGSLEQLPKDEVQVRVLLSAPGEISETDVDLAAASGAVIVGFNTSMASGAKRAADANGVDVREYEVIYKLLEDIQLAMEGLLEPEMIEEVLGEAQVRAIFSIGKSAVAGCYITNGKLQRNCKVRVKRENQIVFEGDLDSLKRNKDDVKEVATGFECGIGCDRFANWQEGDLISGYKFVTQRRKLTS